jgi:hypothetical protein
MDMWLIKEKIALRFLAARMIINHIAGIPEYFLKKR